MELLLCNGQLYLPSQCEEIILNVVQPCLFGRYEYVF